MRRNHDAETTSTTTSLPSRWGRVRFGGGRLPALWTAAPAGVLAAAGFAALVPALTTVGEHRALGALAVFVLLVSPCTALVWALIVDRMSLRGASAKPEQSIEAAWYDRAASGAFHDILLITGVSTAVIAFSGISVPTLAVLSALILIAMGSFGIRYLVQQRRG